ncbi:MAG: TolC family protein [Bacteroidetes bacterium]|nr:TolC family protein [Bacteroidota bacterium]
MKRRIFYFLICLGSISVSLQAQQMTLQECIRVALDNNLTVKRSVYNVETNRVSFLQSKGNFLPTFSLNASSSQNYGRNLNPVTYTYFQGMTRTVNPFVQTQITLFNGFRNQNTYRQNKKNVAAADLDLEKAKNDVIITVVTNYTNVILNKELYENAKFQLNSSLQTLDKIVKQVEAGALPKSNQLNQEAVVATNETNLITQENVYNLSVLQLKQSMQIPASNEIDVVVPNIATEDLIISGTPDEIYAISAQTLPQVRSALLKVESTQFALKAARGSYLPRLTASASATSNYNSASDTKRYGYDFTNKIQQTVGYLNGDQNQPVTNLTPSSYLIATHYDVPQQIQDNLYKNIGLSLSIPILNGLQTRSSVKQAVINRELAEITVKETENTLRQSIETAYNNAVAAAKTYAAANKQVKANEESFRMTQQRYENGAATYIEFQVSSNDLFSAKSALSRAKYNLILTKKVIEFYQGKAIEY